jgi:hypothetical protein
MASIITERKFLISDIVDEIMLLNDDKYNDETDCIYDAKTKFFKSGILLQYEQYGEYSDSSIMQLYYFRDKKYYVIINNYVGSCTGCLEGEYNTINPYKILVHNIEKSYIVDNYKDAITYFKNTIKQFKLLGI